MKTSGPSSDALHELVAGSLALMTRAVAELSADGPDVPAPPLDPEKVVGEALLLLRATAGVVADRSATEAWHALYEAASPLARPDSLGASLCRDPLRALESAFAHVQLSALGDPDPEIDVLLDLALTEPGDGPDPYVVTALQREWLRGLRARKRGRPVPHDLLERSSLGRAVDVLRCSTKDVYDLTHAVMHGTDLGFRAVRCPRPVDDLLADLDALLGLALDADNLDLTAELLWSWPMLRLPWTPAALFAFDVVVGVHGRHGFLPGPGFDRGRHVTLAPVAAESYVLRTSYHAGLALGLLCASTLTAPCAAFVAPAPSAGSARRLLEYLGVGPGSAWLGSVPDDDGLSRMLLAVALRRASDRLDLPAVRKLLELALELDLAAGQPVRQAMTLLRRGTALARLSGG